MNWRHRWRHEPFKTACKWVILAAIVAFAGFMSWLPAHFRLQEEPPEVDKMLIHPRLIPIGD